MILCYLLRHHFVIPRLRSIGSDKEGAHALLHLMKSDMVGGLEYALHGTGVGYFGACRWYDRKREIVYIC